MRSVETLKPLSNRVVTMGMSCVGKTTFCQNLSGYSYHSFDKNFTYQLCALEGVSRVRNWETIIHAAAKDPVFALDNWTTEDALGHCLHRCCPDAVVCVLFDTHRNILARYRSEVVGEDAFLGMYKKMYCRMEFELYHPEVRYFRVLPGGYLEYAAEGFRRFVSENSGGETGMTYDPRSRTWS